MIQGTNQTVEGLRQLLDDEIPTQMGHYAACVATGADTSALHWSVVAHQLGIWIGRLNNLVADSTTLTALQSRYPTWTAAALQGVTESLQRIEQAALPFVDRSVPGWTQKRSLKDVADAAKDNLKSVLWAEVQHG